MCVFLAGCKKSEEPEPTKAPGVCATCDFRPVHVWAAGKGVPNRYPGKDARVPDDMSNRGQPGWDVSMEFLDANDLGRLLGGGYTLPKFFDDKERPFAEGQIQKLAIHVHGGSGGVDMNNAAVSYYNLKSSPLALNRTTLSNPEYQEPFKQLLRVLANDAELYFMSCLTGLGPEGTLFLKEVSRRLASKRVKVIGYVSTLATSGWMMHPRNDSFGDSAKTSYPGCRETSEDSPNKPGAMELDGAGWDKFGEHPWASDSSRRAKIALGGELIREGVDPLLPENTPPVLDDKPKSDPPPKSAPPSSGSQPKPPGRSTQGTAFRQRPETPK